MYYPKQNINIEINEKYTVSALPELSFTSFLDNNGNSFLYRGRREIGCYENDRECSFDHKYKIKKNYDEFKKISDFVGVRPGCKKFWIRFRYAQKVYILDKFFDEENYFRLLCEIDSLSEHSKTAPVTKIIAKNINTLRSFETRHSIYFAREDYLESLEYIHDRFAWIDGEIWHFGAAVGGMHAGYHAVSSGWEDKLKCFEKFCESFFN